MLRVYDVASSNGRVVQYALQAVNYVCFFFFQAEDGIRDYKVTGVQTCALPISLARADHARHEGHDAVDRAVEIDPHEPVPVVVARLLDGLKQIDAGVVEQEAHDA